ncbi:hypothetical protein AYI68_g4025 [Smittium mucronatum]|uniref:Uncharacterized protein n=1 Tax=Smittium mucronatum TaxID=133383 RepID=A0A1R0GYA7_9FUNG|nr:hypothetical protein AYI68_g4025 [Smittium mucronatum]
MNSELLNVLLLPETDIFSRFPELEQKVDYFLFDWDQDVLLKTYVKVSDKIRRKLHSSDPFFYRDLLTKKKHSKSKKRALRAKRLLEEELDTLIRSRNVLWRSYISNKHDNSHKYPPEKINWNKDVDVIFLYGPIYKSEIDLPWRCRSPTSVDGTNLKSALKRTPSQNLYGILTPPNVYNPENQIHSPRSSPTLQISPNSSSDLKEIGFINHDLLKTPPDYDYFKYSNSNVDFELIPSNNAGDVKFKKPKLRFNKQVEQCMVVFRQEEELLPTDFEDTADEDDSLSGSRSSLDSLKLDFNLQRESFLNDFNSNDSSYNNLDIKHRDFHSLISDSRSNKYLIKDEAYDGSVSENNLPISKKGHSHKHSKSKKRRNRSTFVIKLAPTSLKNCNGTRVSSDSNDSITGFNIRKSLLTRNNRKKNGALDDDFGLDIDTDIDKSKSESWIWSTLGLSSPTNIPGSSPNSHTNEASGISSTILSSSPTRLISNISGSVSNAISSKWDILFSPKPSSPSSDSQKANNGITEVTDSGSVSSLEPTFDYLNSGKSSSNYPGLLDSDFYYPSDNRSSEFDFLATTTRSIPNHPADTLSTSSLFYSEQQSSQPTYKAPASMLWPSIKESGENLFDNAEDRIATTVDAVKWLSSFFSNYSPF